MPTTTGFPHPLALLAALTLLAIGYVLLPVFLEGLARYRRPLAVACPEARTQALVVIQPLSSALSAVRGRPHLKVQACTLWPGRLHCRHACVKTTGALAA